MIRYIYILLFFVVLGFSEIIELEDETKSGVDCLILQDENSIICKYEHQRMEKDKELIVQWIDPKGEISRERTVVLPAGHGSIYDFRYIEGRMKGIWQFKVKEDQEEISTTFTLN